MTIREEREEFEARILSPYAVAARDSKGREEDIEPCPLRTCFQRDRDRIIHSKSFRRLKHKTQVFLAPAGDHYRTRLTHTLEVSQIARTISRALWLNEDLTEAIALGHDLGHTPFGHAGERALNTKCPFKHNIQSLRVVEKIENEGKGLNLTWEVRDGIVNHSMSRKAATLEGRVVRLADKIAYINHDMDDAMRAGLLKEEDVPEKIRKILGQTRKERLDYMIKDIVANSRDRDDILMSEPAYEGFLELQKFMFENLYYDSECKAEEGKAHTMLISLFDYYMEHQEKVPSEYLGLMEKYGQSLERTVCDYISCMTDYYSVAMFNELFVPEFWRR
ncbi:MAG: deoxyguanosinetriphosphate triphosphohydrolase [Parasporobacterium sp.]|nr:deoxyguanosinetriphosphate triphosphohydrolase [Parasporobacterium sp.]